MIARTFAEGAPPSARPRPTRRLSPTVRPPDLEVVAWQRALRTQEGEAATFRWRNLGDHPVFSAFAVTNPATGRTYRVAIRGEAPGVNFCSCPDFTASRLGICKHIAFVLHRLRRTPKAAAALAAGYVPPFSEIAVAYDAMPRLRLHLGSECPPALRRLARRKATAEGWLDDARAVDALIAAARAGGHELRVYDDAQALLARRADDRTRRERLAQRFPRGRLDPDLDGILHGVQLHPYQRDGAWFLAERGKAILADDMGLGKTAQAIAAAVLLEQAAHMRQVLVVAPASLLGQWAEEIARFTGKQALVMRGPLEVRAQAWRAREHPWRVVTYEMLPRDLEAITEWGVDLLILDEAQRIKNWPTRAAQAVRRLDAPLAFVLTGTPIENKLDELHALVEVVDRHQLGALPVFKDAHSEYEPGTSKVVGYRDLDRVALAVQPVLLRRTRAQVMDQLPGRTTTVLREPLTAPQREIHDEARKGLALLVARWRRLHFLSERDQLTLRQLLLRMRMVCDDAFLVDPATCSGRKLAQVRTLLEQELRDPTVKAVVFSTWMDMHALIRPVLESRGWGFAFLHGGVPAAQRPALIRRFREDPACRVFLATDCGALGLNLQCATTLINVDLPWNPAVREQRISRIHRQGQRRAVRIYDLIADDGIEAGIARLLAFKSALAAGVLDGGETRLRLEGSTLQRVMRTVEELDRALDPAPAATPATAPPAAGGPDPGAPVQPASPGTGTPSASRPASPAVPAGAWSPDSLGAALSSLSQLVAGLGTLAGGMTVDTDARGGRWVRMPLPDPGVVVAIQQGLAGLGAALSASGARPPS